MTAVGAAALDLHAYLRRIGYAGDLRADYTTLEALHLAHSTHVPFENLDVLLGRPIALDLTSLQSKLVSGARGGYCFEQNLLFAAVLEQTGFAVTRLAARVRYRAQRVLPRTHMLLRVRADGADWIADVGFGGEGLLMPVPLDGTVVRQFAWRYRVHEEPGVRVLQSLRDGAWIDLYAFTFEPQELADCEMASYYTSTHPKSRFVQTLTAQLPSAQARHILRNWELITDTGDAVASRTLSGHDELLQVLADTFGLHMPAGTRFRFQEFVP